jgi:arylsulfatase A-like enzyme
VIDSFAQRRPAGRMPLALAAERKQPPAGVRGALRWVFVESPWLWASVLALWVCCARELLMPARAVPREFPAYLLALASVVALLHGIAWSSVFWLFRQLPALLARLLWFALSFAALWWLARQLGAFTRLDSRYAKLAIYTLCGCGAAAVGIGLACAALQPTAAAPAGWIEARPRWLRYLLALLTAAAFVGLIIADRRIFPNQYPIAHNGLRLGALWALMFTLEIALPGLPKLHGQLWLLAAFGFASCLIFLDERRVQTLNAFSAHPIAQEVLQLCRRLVDFDRDGYASFLGAADCAPWDARVHPGAHDIPDNGIDENCILGDAKSAKTKIELPPPPKEPAPLDVVLITIDALNPYHLGLYNPKAYGPQARATTPNLDKWAENATVFNHAYTPGGWTSVAIPALLRGMYARHLHWIRYFETNRFAIVAARDVGNLPPGEQRLHMFPLAFGDPHPTIAELMKRRGMQTIGITDDGYSAMLQRGTGIERGFDSYQEVDSLPEDQRNDSGTAGLAILRLKGIPETRRFFMWVHFFGTHWPDDTHPGIRVYGTRPTDYYDHEIAYLDTQLKRLLDELATRKAPVAVFITADHGEGLNAITRYHGDTLDEPVVRIPLLARVPGWPIGRIEREVSSIDLLPTILRLVNEDAPRYLDGIDLGPLAHGELGQRRILFSDTWRYNGFGKLEVDQSAAYDGARKFLFDRLTGGIYYENQAARSQVQTAATLVGFAPFDALSGAVVSYVEETGTLQVAEQ